MRSYIAATLTAIVLGSASAATAGSPNTWYVRADAPGGANNGTSWADAFSGPQGLQSALAVAVAGDEIWVAAGTYTPTATTDRSLTHQPPAGVAVYGGFSGGETLLEQRDWFANRTVLSGDLQGDDGFNFANRSDNSHHVVRITGDAILDGFTIRGGNGNESLASNGGGIALALPPGTSTSINNCRIIQNEAEDGGGVGLFGNGFVEFRNCLFAGNRSPDPFSLGGGILISNSFPETPPRMINCAFVDNTAGEGGGLLCDHSFINLYNCTFTRNTGTANHGGGALFIGTFGNLTTINCILWGNTSAGGSQSETAQLWAPSLPGYLTLAQSCIQGFTGTFNFPGPGNFDADPLFVSPLGVDGVPGTGDEDLRLQPGSPCIDAADNTLLAGTLTDLANAPRFVEDPATPDTGAGTPPIADLGAYEFQAGAPVPAFTPLGTLMLATLMGLAAAILLRYKSAGLARA